MRSVSPAPPKLHTHSICTMVKSQRTLKFVCHPCPKMFKSRPLMPRNHLIDISSKARIPVVDPSLLCSPSSTCSGKEQQDEPEKLKSALSEWGCFQAIGHGIPEKVCVITKEFFALPVEGKQKYARDPAHLEGHGSDPILSDEQFLDCSKRLFLNLLPLDSRKLKLWPETPEGFREALAIYFEEVKSVIDLLQKAMARFLDLEENCFSGKYGSRAFMAARFNHYPPCSRPDSVLCAKAHSDGSGITVLSQDEEVEGLQILKDDRWFRVPVVPDAFERE